MICDIHSEIRDDDVTFWVFSPVRITCCKRAYILSAAFDNESFNVNFTYTKKAICFTLNKYASGDLDTYI